MSSPRMATSVLLALGSTVLTSGTCAPDLDLAGSVTGRTWPLAVAGMRSWDAPPPSPGHRGLAVSASTKGVSPPSSKAGQVGPLTMQHCRDERTRGGLLPQGAGQEQSRLHLLAQQSTVMMTLVNPTGLQKHWLSPHIPELRIGRHSASVIGSLVFGAAGGGRGGGGAVRESAPGTRKGRSCLDTWAQSDGGLWEVVEPAQEWSDYRGVYSLTAIALGGRRLPGV